MLSSNEWIFSQLLLFSANTEIPSQITCPISLKIMTNPVVASDGFTYESEIISEWLRRHPISPFTGQNIDPDVLITNQSIRSLIQEFLEKHPELNIEDNVFVREAPAH